jgi:tetratricopeptide (TPR) repeat protein
MALPEDPTADLSPSAEARRELGRGISVGRYLLLDLLGEGGMGVVYKAYDPDLGRPIALKLLHTTGSSHSRERLLREAQALARLAHPNVVAVHDVGLQSWAGGTDVFLAMEFVEGQTVRQWLKAKPRSHREILDVYLAAGEGLAAAHRAGLVHRDFKPDNVIVGDDGRVRVLDFGLARAANTTLNSSADVSAKASANVNVDVNFPTDSGRISARLLETPLTHAGAIVGTPRFMAPEQHLDGAVEEPADQFSFCVSLYWSLYGAFPFADPAATIAGKILDAPPSSSVPRWLRQVLIRGLLPRPAARYPSMAALLEALRADPAIARRRWLRGALAVASSVALVSAAVAGGLAYKARRGAAERARLAQQFGQEVEKISAIARYAAFLPLHDTRREMDTIRARMERLRERMRTLGPLAAGPGHHALGRGYLALERYDDALRELEAARASGYVSPELNYALGLVHGKLYQRALAALRKSGDAKLDAAHRAEIEHAHRDPALRYLREAGGREAGVDAPEYVEGLIALYEQKFDQALALARKASERVSWLFEARTLEGDIHLVASRDRYFTGDVEASLLELERAGEAYRAVTAVAHSDGASRLGECRRLLEVIDLQVDRDQDPDANVKSALAACGAASVVRPGDATPIVQQAQAMRGVSTYQRDHGRDPTDASQQAIRLGEQALALDPTDVSVHQVMSSAENELAHRLLETGGDPSAALERSIAHALEALKLEPDYLGGHHHLILVYRTRGDYEASRGIDPRRSYREGIEHGRKALELSPGNFSVYNGIGLNYLFMGQWELAHGYDPTESLGRAEEAMDQVVKISPKLDYGHVNKCEAIRNLAEFQMERDLDPRPLLERAIAACLEAIRLDGNYVGSQWDLGAARLDLAVWQLAKGGDPTELVAGARADLEHALSIDHEYQLAVNSLAEAELVEARWLAARKRDPRRAFARAESLSRSALDFSKGKSIDAMRVLAEVLRRRAETGAPAGGDRSADVREGIALASRALEKDPRLAIASAIEGALELTAARAAKPAERAAIADRARAALERALAIDANLARAYGPLQEEAQRLAQAAR